MMECTTGLTDDEFDELLAWLREEGVEGYPPILGLSGSLRATLMYLRQNLVQAVIGEILGVSQPTVSRAIKALTEALSRTLTVKSLGVVFFRSGGDGGQGGATVDGATVDAVGAVVGVEHVGRVLQ